ncbi:hypothetical protein JXA32_14220 [Candidatus Sumerlaeota bacterium]|nr:hypothetical protein [Candidatus Sumerlaeota bacterium]
MEIGTRTLPARRQAAATSVRKLERRKFLVARQGAGMACALQGTPLPHRTLNTCQDCFPALQKTQARNIRAVFSALESHRFPCGLFFLHAVPRYALLQANADQTCNDGSQEHRKTRYNYCWYEQWLQWQ